MPVDVSFQVIANGFLQADAFMLVPAASDDVLTNNRSVTCTVSLSFYTPIAWLRVFYNVQRWQLCICVAIDQNNMKISLILVPFQMRQTLLRTLGEVINW